MFVFFPKIFWFSLENAKAFIGFIGASQTFIDIALGFQRRVLLIGGWGKYSIYI